MEALLIINSLLVAVCLYFVKDFHGDFKELSRTVNLLRAKVAAMSVRMDSQIKSVKKRLSKKTDRQQRPRT